MKTIPFLKLNLTAAGLSEALAASGIDMSLACCTVRGLSKTAGANLDSGEVQVADSADEKIVNAVIKLHSI